ncbi:hypothetical protein GmHk_10G028901 [Glycine max]|nr:hypothetical protein GmHk_10G028901 [Glycine max]KAH1229054.1 hypothetical protein GmHk_10G028901 [Glycine max]
MNTFLAWPTHLVKHLSEQAVVSAAKPPDRLDHEVDDPLYLMILTIPQLFLKPLQVLWDATVFGVFNEHFPLHLTETSMRAGILMCMDSLSHSPFRDLGNRNLNKKVT